MPFAPRVITAILAGDFAAASAAMRCGIGSEFGHDADVFAYRLKQLEEDATLAPWSIRAVVRAETGVAVGHAGLHGRAGTNSLEDPAGVEVGYTILEAHRRQGFAEEAARGLFAWAATQPGVKRGIVSIAPSNEPSLRFAAKLGMRYLTAVWDDDGPEHVFWNDLPL